MWDRQSHRAPTPGLGRHTGCPVIIQPTPVPPTYHALPASRQSSNVPAHKGCTPLPRARGLGLQVFMHVTAPPHRVAAAFTV
jgi:hypothetical protein